MPILSLLKAAQIYAIMNTLFTIKINVQSDILWK